MSVFLASVATYTVLLTLVVASVGHARRPGALASALGAHGLVPTPWMAAIAVTVVEGLLGAVLVIAVLQDVAGLLVAGLACSVVLFGGYGGYGWYVLASGRAGPCGCGRVEVPMSGWVVGRTFALAALAGCGLALSGSALPLTSLGAELVVALLVAGTFGVLLGYLPAAMHYSEAMS